MPSTSIGSTLNQTIVITPAPTPVVKYLCEYFNQTANYTESIYCYKECCPSAKDSSDACCNDIVSFWLGIAILFPMIGACFLIPLIKVFGGRIQKAVCLLFKRSDDYRLAQTGPNRSTQDDDLVTVRYENNDAILRS